MRLLAGYRGYLMTDDYAGYNAVTAQEGIERELKEADGSERLAARQQRSQPLLDQLETCGWTRTSHRSPGRPLWVKQ